MTQTGFAWAYKILIINNEPCIPVTDVCNLMSMMGVRKEEIIETRQKAEEILAKFYAQKDSQVSSD